ncbi:MAG TPA: DUF998 domain-containing protein [Flavitalea sp.]|nr:DUF998 domain-containing protein [Flavitalea sp.]HMG09469.1 DUF998 domain-containing protein [Mucilaginibacter sp.]
MSTYDAFAGTQQQTIKPMLAKAANISLWSSTVFLVLVVALHFIKPEFAPSWRFLSEYAIGNNGWIMQLAFFFLSASCIAGSISVRSQVKTTAGKIGVWLLFIVGLSVIVAGFFVMDPVTAGKDELTTHGNLHGMSSMIGVPGLSIAAMLISFSLADKNPNWTSAKAQLKLAAYFCLICLVVMFATVFMGLSKTGGKFGPDVLAGWANRLLVVSWYIWLVLIAKNIIRISTNQQD